MKLDTDVSEYLPFQIRNPKNKGTVTLRSLLTHTSSISDDHYTNYSLPPRIFYTLGVKPTISLHEFCVGFFRAGGAYYDAESFLSASRGTRCQYSDLAYALIGYLVERVTKEPFSEYCKRRIFRPLGMLDTSFDLKDYKVGSGYSNLTDYNPSNAIQAYLRTDTVGQYSVSDYPNGWLRTSALDLSIFMRMLLAGGTWRGARILSGKTLSSMFKPQVPKTVLDFSLQSSGVTPGKTLLAQGYSFYQYRFNKASYWGHDGADDTGPVAGMWLDLERNRGAFILSNTYDGEDELATENLHHSIQQLLELKCHRRQP